MSNGSTFTGTFEYAVENVSEMPLDLIMRSKPYMSGNLSWEIWVEKILDDSVYYLGVYLCCSVIEGGPSWKCVANYTLSVLAFDTKEGVNTEDRSYTFKYLFRPESSGWGMGNFIEWEEIMEESNGFMSNDQIIIRADVKFSFPIGFSPRENRSLDLNLTDSSSMKKPMNRSTVTKIEAELVQLKMDLMSERSNSKKISKDLKMKSAKIESLQSTIASLEEQLKTEKLDTDKKLKESQLQIDLMNEKSNTEKISEELKTKSAEFESSLGAMKEKIISLEELLKTEKLETAKKLKDLCDQLEKEKLIVEAYKDMFQKILS